MLYICTLLVHRLMPSCMDAAHSPVSRPAFRPVGRP